MKGKTRGSNCCKLFLPHGATFPPCTITQYLFPEAIMFNLVLTGIALLAFLGLLVFIKTLLERVLFNPDGADDSSSNVRDPQSLKVEIQSSVLTDRELAFYHQLIPTIPGHLILLCKVRMEDVMRVDVAVARHYDKRIELL
jgi:hypothetical protein